MAKQEFFVEVSRVRFPSGLAESEADRFGCDRAKSDFETMRRWDSRSLREYLIALERAATRDEVEKWVKRGYLNMFWSLIVIAIEKSDLVG